MFITRSRFVIHHNGKNASLLNLKTLELAIDYIT